MRILAIGLLATILSIGMACSNPFAGEAPMPGSNELASPDAAKPPISSQQAPETPAVPEVPEVPETPAQDVPAAATPLPPAVVSMPAPPSWGEWQECDLPNSLDLLFNIRDLGSLGLAGQGDLFEGISSSELLQGAEEWLSSNQCLLIEDAVVLRPESDETIVIRAAGGERLALGGFVNNEFRDSDDFYIGCLDPLFKGELEIPDDPQSIEEAILALGELLRLFEPAEAGQEITLTVIWDEETDRQTGYPLVQCLRTDQPSRHSTIRQQPSTSPPPIRTLVENGSRWGDTLDCGLPSLVDFFTALLGFAALADPEASVSMAEVEGFVALLELGAAAEGIDTDEILEALFECVLIERTTVLGFDRLDGAVSLRTRNGVIEVQGIENELKTDSTEAPDFYIVCLQPALESDVISPSGTHTLEGAFEVLNEAVTWLEPVSIGQQVTLVAIIPQDQEGLPTCWWKP